MKKQTVVKLIKELYLYDFDNAEAFYKKAQEELSLDSFEKSDLERIINKRKKLSRGAEGDFHQLVSDSKPLTETPITDARIYICETNHSFSALWYCGNIAVQNSL